METNIDPRKAVYDKDEYSDPMTVFRLVDNNLSEMNRLLDEGLDPNIQIRKGKGMIHFCKSIEMLQLLLSYGLNVSLNKPMLGCSMRVFKRLVEDFKLDPYEYYWDYTDPQKVKYLNLDLMSKRNELESRFTKHLIPPLVNEVLNYIFPPLRVSSLK